MRNVGKLIENLQECEGYITRCLEGQQAKDANIARMINNCLSQFTADDMQLLEQMVHQNFRDAMLTHNLAKL